jgi:hypothetical protein
MGIDRSRTRTAIREICLHCWHWRRHRTDNEATSQITDDDATSQVTDVEERAIKQVVELHSNGRCTRFPPIVLPDNSTGWPTTKGMDWCGEWRVLSRKMLRE